MIYAVNVLIWEITKGEIYMDKIKLKKHTCFENKYYILLSNKEIGFVKFIRKNKIIIISYLYIYTQYQHNHCGYQVVEYLLSHYKSKCIIGETLKTSRSFWNKCIHKYNGQRKNIYYSDNCTSSFIIPKYKITDSNVYDLLEYAYEKI